MSNVLQLRRKLLVRPVVPQVPGVTLRSYQAAEDIEAWLRIRHRTFAKESLGVREWTAADFQREFLTKPWWQPERMWLAEAGDLLHAQQPVGAVTWADRGAQGAIVPAVHWLMVLPGWRRRGIAALLMAAMEQACWDAGHRELFLETHASWTAAAKFYQQHGWEPWPPTT
jgi:GNAT superfamily N-acetyltransferase